LSLQGEERKNERREERRVDKQQTENEAKSILINLQVFLQRGHRFQALALTNALADLVDLVAGGEGVTVHGLPLVEGALREGLATSGGTEGGSETEGLIDGQVGTNEGHGGTRPGNLLNDLTTTKGESRVDTTNVRERDSDLGKVEGLHEGRLGSVDTGVDEGPGGGEDLAHTTMDRVGVEDDVHKLHDDTTASLLAEGASLGADLETVDDGVLDLVEVLDGTSGIHDPVGALTVRTEAPELLGHDVIAVEAVGIGKVLGLLLGVLGVGDDLVALDISLELLGHGVALAKETVVLVGGLGQASLVGLGLDGLTVRNDGVGDLDGGTLHEVILEILQADLQVELTSTSDDVLASLLVGDNLDERVGLGETLETLDELGEIGRVLDLNGDAHDGGDGELHGLDGVGIIVVRDGTVLDEVLVNTDEGASVTGGDVVDRLGLGAHHDDGTLDVLDPEIGGLAGLVVGAHNADLVTSDDLAGEDTTEGVETARVGGGHHLGDEHHEGTRGIATTHGDGEGVIERALVQHVGTVLLGLTGGRQVEHNHLKDGVTSGEPLLHDLLHEGLALEILQ
jgi:hypothetical protein